MNQKATGTLLAIALIAAAGLAVYHPALEAGFYLDDIPSIVNNHAITEISNLGGIWNFWPTRFLVYLSLAANHHFSGLNPVSYHAFNILIHLLAALTAYLLLSGLFSLSRPAALAGALFFLLHPVQTQAVTYVIQRAASLAALFYLGAVYFYFKSFHRPPAGRETGEDRSALSPPAGRRKGIYLLAVLFAGAAFLSKEYAVTLPLLLWLLQALVKGFGRLIRWKGLIPFFVLALIIPALAISHRHNPYYQDSGQLQFLPAVSPPAAADSAPPVSVPEYLRTQPRVMLTYLRLVFYPVSQRLDYDYPFFQSLLQPAVAASLAVLAALLILAVKTAAVSPVPAIGILWFFLTLLPESSVVPILDPIAEHRLYLPLFGPALLLGWFARDLFAARRRVRTGFAAILLCLAALTFFRNRAWTDPVSFWEANAARAPGKARVLGNLGKAYLDGLDRREPLPPGRKERYLRGAREAFEKVIELDPSQGAAYVNLGVIHIDHLRDYAKAERYLRTAIELYPDYPQAHLNLGVIRLNRGELEEAIEKFTRVIELDPLNPGAYLNLSACYINLGRLEEGIDWIRRGLAIWPEEPAYYDRLALIERRRGVDEQAARYAERAAQLRLRRGY